MIPISINLAVEDAISEAILRKILQQSSTVYSVGHCYCRGGFGYLKKNIGSFNRAAINTPFLVLADLDNSECPPAKVRSWLSSPKAPNLLFRIAVREVEAWVLADRDNFAEFLMISKDRIPFDVDALPNPKEYIVTLAKKSKRRSLREDIVPRPGSTAKQGPDYNRHLILFINNYWNLEIAKSHSESLKRTVAAIQSFVPVIIASQASR